MIFLISGILWLVSLVTVARLFFMADEPLERRGYKVALWVVIFGLSGVLLFRPHADIFGGADSGAYINAAAAYAGNRSFFYADPLLSQVTPSVRQQFMYGAVQEYGLTKNACLWVHDMDRAIIGPNFFPAYPLLMSGIVRLFPVSAALFVVPLFTIFLAVALRALAARLSSFRWAGILAFLLFLICPLVVWHGRNPRPEIIAAFMFFGGFTLLLNAWQGRRWARWYDVVLGSVCIGCAPFFHVTSAPLVICCAVMVCALIVSGRDDFLFFPVIGYVFLILLAVQAKYVTNYYHIYSFIWFVLEKPLLTAGLFAVLFGLLCGACLAARRWTWRDWLINSTKTKKYEHSVAGWFSVLTALMFAALYFLESRIGGLALVEHYLYLVDMGAAVNMLSTTVCLAAVAGWILMFFKGAGTPAMRLGFGLTVFPAMLFAGRINDFSMTRCLMITFVPVAVLCLVALLNPLKNLSAKKGAACAGVFVFLAALILPAGRTHLVTLRAHRGSVSFIEKFAEEIKNDDNSILLCEYSRLAGPFEHVFGIPTLGIDNERMTDYTDIETEWERIMLANLNSPAFFLTPFNQPLSELFVFEKVMSMPFHAAKIQSDCKALPEKATAAVMQLSLYRMRSARYRGPPFERHELPEYDFPFVRLPDAGNMGMKNFSMPRERNWSIKGLAVGSGVSIRLPAERADRVFLVFKTMGNVINPDPPVVSGGYSAVNQKEIWRRIFGDWWIYEISGAPVSFSGDVRITSRLPAYLVEALVVEGGDVYSGFGYGDNTAMEDIPLPGLEPRWTRAYSEMLLPVPDEGSGTILLFACRPGTDGLLNLNFGGVSTSGLMPEPEKWQWIAMPFSGIEANTKKAWLGLGVDAPWDSGVEGFPADLGIMLGAAAVIGR